MALMRERGEREPTLRELFEQVRLGNAVLGECSEDHGYSIVLPGRGEVRVMCAYDALMTAALRREGKVRGSCPHCGEKVVVQIENGEVNQASPPSIIFWLGTGSRGNPICDHLHLFSDSEHLQAWVEEQPDELGAAVPINEVVHSFGLSQELRTGTG